MSEIRHYQVLEPLYSSYKNSPYKKNVLQGGTSSAKTYTALQVLFDIAMENRGVVITVVGQDIPNLKKGAIRDSENIVASSPAIRAQVLTYNIADRIYKFRNGSKIEYTSYLNAQDAKSGKRDYLFVNEANGISYEIYFELSIRTTVKEYLDYNPNEKFWVHEKLLGTSNCQLWITDHRHNTFLTQDKHDEIEGIEDKELWWVYARGRTGKIHGLIYPKYYIIEEMPLIFGRRFGLDFGFNHKMALIETIKDGNRLFWDELIYLSDLTISDLIELMKPLDLGYNPIFCDHAAPDKIEDLRRAGFNAIEADKDVKNGIDFVKRHKLYITRRSTGIRKEILSYKWKVDKKTGITLDEPYKFRDDAMDAGRYGSYSQRKNMEIGVSNAMEAESELDWLLEE